MPTEETGKGSPSWQSLRELSDRMSEAVKALRERTAALEQRVEALEAKADSLKEKAEEAGLDLSDWDL